MGYGRGEYGEIGYGSSALDAGGPTLVSSTPSDGAVNVPPNVPVTLHIQSPAGLDEFSLNVTLNGAQAIVGSVFRPGYSGTIVIDPETDMVVTISTHPLLPNSSIPVNIFVRDLFGLTASINIAFSPNSVMAFSETVTFSEDLVVSRNQVQTVSETLAFQLILEAGDLEVVALDASTLDVSFPIELKFDGIRDLNNYRLAPVSSDAASAFLVDIEPSFTVHQTGSSLYALAPEYAYLAHPNHLVQGSSESSTTNVLDSGSSGTFTTLNVFDYIELQNGNNTGRYQILGVDFLNLGGPTPRPRLILDRLVSLRDTQNGYVDGLAEIVAFDSSTLTLRLNHPAITPSDPIIEVLLVLNRNTGLSLELSYFLITPSNITLLAYNQFQIQLPVSPFPVTSSDRIFVQARVSSKVQWQHTSGVQGLTCRTNPGTKLTLEKEYSFSARDLRTKETNALYAAETLFQASPPLGHEQSPRVLGVTFDPVEGVAFVEFDQDMRVDADNLVNPSDYTITGPSSVQIKRVYTHTTSIVALVTSGIGPGDYTLTVSTNTPKDVAGNPIDPLFNTIIFTAATPETTRSIFTDKGPIAKPPLTLQTGTGASLQTYNEVVLPGSSLSLSNIGNYVRLSGGSLNGGSFRIAAVLTATRVRLANASFTLPDPSSGSLTWTVYDPRHGQIADDPADVSVRINGTPVVAEAVVGLLGQILLNTAPAPSDDVKVDYSWLCNPTVEFRQLNSREFRLNAWNRDEGFARDQGHHKYRYNNVLVRPEDYDPDDVSAVLDQPLFRELHYRAYERAYTPVLNDPSLLVLNSPIHRIAFPSAQRSLAEQFVAYEGVGLPESQVTDSWTRKGSGTAVSTTGHLSITDTSTGPYPTGQPLFWTRPIDLTFPHVFALSWRFTLDSTTPDGVFTGVAAGYSNDKTVLVVGYLRDGGTKKIGILKRGSGDDPSLIAAWTGGIDNTNSETGLPAEIDWDVLHSYRIYRDRSGIIKVFVDGSLEELLRVTEDELPFLEELSGPFDEIQGAFFGSLSRPAQNSSTWDFVRYLIQPTNPNQTTPSSFVNYEGTVVPEQDAKPWTPVGSHGTETIQTSGYLLLDSTSATDDATASAVGLVGGDYKGFVRFEPLLTQTSEVVLDAQVELLTYTHGVTPYGLTFAVDDGNSLMQVSFLADLTSGQIAKISYGGRSFPEDFAPFAWQTAGTQPVAMVGRILMITDGSTTDGRVYFHDDLNPVGSTARSISYLLDYIVEFRCRVLSFTVDGSGFAGVFVQAYDSARSVGLLFEIVSGTRYVSFHSDGTTLGSSARFAFDWGDTLFHTYRFVKSTTGNLVSLFIDGVFLGSLAYSTFLAPPADPVGQLSFGSSTPASSGAESVVEWAYVNAWRVRPTTDYKRYVGIWKGTANASLLDYHLPVKATGRNATVAGNALGDIDANFIADGVVTGDRLVIDSGGNKGVYQIAGVGSATTLTVIGVWPAQPSVADYRILKETDWSSFHKYRLHRTSTGEVALLLDVDPEPIIRIGYNSIDLPASGVGIIRTLGDGLPTIAFGSFDPQNLEQSLWDFVRYGLTMSSSEQRIAPHHQVLNQWNVMESPERLFTLLPHELTSFKSSSTGIVPKKNPDFLADPGLTAFTLLNQDTPLVPKTQSFEVRAPFPVQEFVSALNRPEDVLNNVGSFVLNDASKRFKLIVPDDVLYSSLDVIEQTTGTDDLLVPYDDECQPTFGGVQYQKEVCLTYDGSVLPENDVSAPTRWKLVSDAPSEVTASTLGGVLTYGTSGLGTRTVYRNDTPLPDHPSLINEMSFRLKLFSDSTQGTGPTPVAFGFSAPGMTAALTFVTSPLGERFVLVVDLNNNNVLGSVSFDFNDGQFHTYRIVRDPGKATVEVFIDS